ncbi:MAG: cytidine deaminase [Acidobacteriota bacterium]|nr:cytidine deaminase [Acidobacteriota bacterium]
MSDSDTRKSRVGRGQPAPRTGDRRSGSERRTHAAAPPKPERRTHQRRTGRDRRSETGWQLVEIVQTVIEDEGQDSLLLAAAADARTRAHAQYSNFRVGAALETPDGRIISGCNIENATFGLTLCAERVALVKALSDGEAVFTRIAVVADTEAPTPPCGPCRQLLWEYCGDIDIILGNLDGPTARYRLSALLPLPFDRRLLG